ncbi:MAG: hypothetical protein V1664_00570 [Candidatus Uhrbacteria bacterium]
MNFNFSSNTKKTVLIVGGAAVVVVLIILAVRWFVDNQSQSVRREAMIEKVSNELDNSRVACEKEKNSSFCFSQKVETAALQVGAVELCQKLSGQDLVECVWRVAQEKSDIEACALLSEKDSQSNCRDLIYRDLAGTNFDLAQCEKITKEIVRTRCVNTVSKQIARDKGCQGTGVDQSLCDSLTAFDAAVTSEDPDQCLLLINNDDQLSCLDIVGSGDKDHDDLEASFEARLGTSDENVDSDNDSLSDHEEYYEYGTNPAKADTDGDGYSDGVEVKGGYNPLGSGQL